MMTEPLDIDPESKALQFRTLEGDDQLVLEPAYPQFPRTPAENAAIAQARGVIPTDSNNRLIIPANTRGRLEVETGDVVSLGAVVSAHVGVCVDTVSEALGPVEKILSEMAEEMVQVMAEILSDANDRDQEENRRDDRLPEQIREARRRRETQREQYENSVGAERFRD